ncbi:hypothetical protein JIQ42_06686 [Leishmania sp. Namibia]|uniref:hypothetical protein n=1 Tax=Leishmania sp. Namibia TaxID=2802991 RepID=UPI001B6DBF78|nr:hypothetical protein JIQ42_06686 [Leishmania sp. Namibia]
MQPQQQDMASTVSSASTAVDTDDILQQYERLLFQLSQQVLEQEEEIRSLRTVRQASQHGHHRRHVDSDVGGSEQHKRAAAVITTESLSLSVKGCRQGRAQSAVATEAAQMARSNENSPLRLTHPLPSTPQVSSIGSAEDVDDHSVMEPSPEPTARPPQSPQYSATGSTAPSWTRSVGKSSGQQAATSVLACSSAMCDVSSASDNTNGGLTPSAVCDCAPSGKTAFAEAFWASSPKRAVESGSGSGSGSLLRCRRTTAQWTRHAPLETPQVKFDGQDAMSYLLSVFSSAKSARDADRAETEVMTAVSEARVCERENGEAAAARSRKAPLQQRGRHVARRLFCLDVLEEDEGSESGSEPPSGGIAFDYPRPAPRQSPSTPSRDRRGDGNSCAPGHHRLYGAFDEEDGFWQERYARIMACALAAEQAAADTIMEENETEQQQQQQQHGGGIRPRAPAVARCRIASLHDQSASATAAHLLRLFTLESTARHTPETNAGDRVDSGDSFSTIA